jgi:hypothetical protein
MSYVVDLLRNKKEEYQSLLQLVNRQLESYNILRSKFERDSALTSKTRYEEILRDIDEKLSLIESSNIGG